MNSQTADSSALNRLQNELYKMLNEFKEKCEENHLRYFLAYGSLLGAIRHDGFIPWDDDIDLMMPREDADKFVELFKDYYSDECYLDGYNCKEFNSFAPNIRINSKHFMLRQDKNGKEAYVPAFISIFIVDGLPNNSFVRKLHIKRLDLQYGILRLSRSNVQGVLSLGNRSFKERMFISLNKFFRIGAIITPRKAAKKYNNLLRKYPADKECEKVFVGWDSTWHRVLDKTLFDETVTHVFEGNDVSVPKEYDTLLRIWYKDYMKLPPEDQRQPHHGIEIKIVE